VEEILTLYIPGNFAMVGQCNKTEIAASIKAAFATLLTTETGKTLLLKDHLTAHETFTAYEAMVAIDGNMRNYIGLPAFLPPKPWKKAPQPFLT
jgi:hypothetical protein